MSSLRKDYAPTIAVTTCETELQELTRGRYVRLSPAARGRPGPPAMESRREQRSTAEMALDWLLKPPSRRAFLRYALPVPGDPDFRRPLGSKAVHHRGINT